MRRELLRALGEWVHACEEVRSNNSRLEAVARADHNKRLVAVRRANARKAKEEAAQWEAHRKRVLSYNADAQTLQKFVATAETELAKLKAAHSLLMEWLSKEEVRRRGRRGGSGLIEGVEAAPQWKVPKACMVRLWEISNSTPPEGWAEEDEAGKKEGLLRPGTAPPMLEGWERTDVSLESLDVRVCHPVPAGVSSSALSGGSGGGSRSREGYLSGNDQPLLADTLLSLDETRPPNASALRAGEYRTTWDATNWDFEAATRTSGVRRKREAKNKSKET